MKKLLSVITAAAVLFGSTIAYASASESIYEPAVEIYADTSEAEDQADLLEYKELEDGTLEVSCSDENREKLTNIVIPPEKGGKKVTHIGANAFSRCYNLETIVIPDSVTEIGSNAFNNTPFYDNQVGVKYAGRFVIGCDEYVKVATIDPGTISICDNAFYLNTYLTSLVIPDSVKSIGDSAFEMCWNLTALDIPSGVTYIGNKAFKYCESLVSIIIPNNVTSIGYSAFYGCNNLTSVTISTSVTSIGNYAFCGCRSLSSVTVPDSVTSIGNYAFCGCTSLNDVTVPDSVTYIGDNVFENCTNLSEAKIPNNIQSIVYCMFLNCSNLKSVNLPNSVKNIEEYAFAGCSELESVEIPNSTEKIDRAAFANCTSISSIKIPNKVKSLPSEVFKGCSNLKNVTIPNSITHIPYKAFGECNEIKDVYFTGTEKQWKKVLIDSGNDSIKNATIHFIGSEPIPIEITIPKPEDGAPKTTNMLVSVTLCTTLGDILIDTIPINEDGTIDLSNVPDGRQYTFTFSADNCAPREYLVEVLPGSVTGLENGVELRLCGDIDDKGDGIVDIRDVAKANMYFKTGTGLSGYMLTVSDVNSDNVINIKDVALMNAHFKKTGNLWAE